MEMSFLIYKVECSEFFCGGFSVNDMYFKMSCIFEGFFSEK